MRKLSVFLLLLLLLTNISPSLASAGSGSGSSAASSSTAQIFIDGKKIATEVPPQIRQSTTLVPLRTIAEELGADVSWDKQQQKVSVQTENKSIELYIGKTAATINGSAASLQTAPVMIQNTTMLPLRFVGEQLGMLVSWDQLTKSVLMFRQQTADSSVLTGDPLPGTDIPSQPDNSGPAAQPSGQQPTASGNGGTVTAPAGESAPEIETDPQPSDKPAAGTTDSGKGQAANILINDIQATADQVLIQANGALSVKDFYLTDPDRIILDIDHASLGANLADPSLSNPQGEIAVNQSLVAKIRYALNTPTTLRIVIELKGKSGYTLTPSADGSQLAVSFAKSAKKYKVVLDAGHGGYTPGTTSINNRMEKTFTLAVILKLQQQLMNDPDIEVYLTRSDDSYVGLDERAEFANRLGADLFLSVHGNSFNATTRGTETYYCRPDNSKLLADIVQKHMLAATGFPDRKVKQNDYRVIKATTMPAVLTEVGFLSNKEEEEKMFNDDFQNQVATELAAAVREYLHR